MWLCISLFFQNYLPKCMVVLSSKMEQIMYLFWNKWFNFSEEFLNLNCMYVLLYTCESQNEEYKKIK